VVGALLIGAVILYFIRRQRKKTKFAAREPEPDMDVLRGPVYNHTSTRTGKYFSPDTVGTSTDAVTSEHVSRVSPMVTNGGSHGESALGEGGQQELDGKDTQIEPALTRSTEEEPQAHELPSELGQPERREPMPVYHELAGRELTRSEHDAVSTVGSLPSHVGREEGDDHLDSPFVSTLGSMGWQDEGADASSDMVSPATPVNRSSKRFSA
jgi:hypothetical protein